MNDTDHVKDFHAGFAALIGRPNVGKSTLMNQVLGVRLSIATPKPQTTRNRILGIHTVAERGQIVFVDTPGIHAHRGKRRLNKAMVDAAWRALGDTDLVLFVVEANSLVRHAGRPFWGEDEAIAEALAQREIPTILVINKIDQLEQRDALLPALAACGELGRFLDMVPLCATRGDNVERLVDVLLTHLPEGAALFPEDALTDRAERFFAAEMIREQVLRQTEREVPYSVAVEVEEFTDDPRDGSLEIGAVLHVERESQKGILIGRQGQRLKEIGTAARKRLEEFFGRHVRLRTLVRVQSEWADRDRDLRRFGYGEEH